MDEIKLDKNLVLTASGEVFEPKKILKVGTGWYFHLPIHWLEFCGLRINDAYWVKWEIDGNHIVIMPLSGEESTALILKLEKEQS